MIKNIKGLKYDDLIVEENDVVKEALRRLPAKQASDRAYRLKVAFGLSTAKAELPRDQWTKPSEDEPYLLPIIEEVEKEFKEREQFDTLKGR
ncbi:ubiquinol-cytochrome c reductase complex 14 kDa protein [Neoconidiobolus thromboides FSU 785]|nr:ubiquinol-cytochrome c reductase complex 14 kDa protein [Neoconidiobolus thromboides FSU 785]